MAVSPFCRIVVKFANTNGAVPEKAKNINKIDFGMNPE